MTDQVMTCGQCGREAAPDDRFCGGCGAQLPPPSQFCTSCGAENAGGKRFCTSCGRELVSGSAPPAAGPPPAAAPAGPPAAGPPPAAAPAGPPAAPAAAAPQDDAASSGFSVTQPVALLGAVVAGVGALLAWFDFAGATTGAFDVPALYLLDYQTSSGDTVSVGLLVMVLAGAAVLACLVPGFGERRPTVRLIGSGLLGVAVLYGVQLMRTANEFGGSFTDYIGIGPIVTAVGAAAVLSGR